MGKNPPVRWKDSGRKTAELSHNPLPPFTLRIRKVSGGADSRMRSRLRNEFPWWPGNYREQLWKSALRTHPGLRHRSQCRSLAPFSLQARTGRRNGVSREVREAIRVRDLRDLDRLGMAVYQKRTGRFAPIPVTKRLSGASSKRTSIKPAARVFFGRCRPSRHRRPSCDLAVPAVRGGGRPCPLACPHSEARVRRVGDGR